MAAVFCGFCLACTAIVAYYDFNGNAKDVSGYNNNASIHGAALTQDRFGRANQAFLFDGVQSHLFLVTIPDCFNPRRHLSVSG